MSLIFNALKRNRSGRTPLDDEVQKPSARRNRLSLGTFFASPVIIFIIAAAIFISGLFVAHGVQSFSASAPPDPPVVRASIPQFTAFVPQSDKADAATSNPSSTHKQTDSDLEMVSLDPAFYKGEHSNMLPAQQADNPSDFPARSSGPPEAPPMRLGTAPKAESKNQTAFNLQPATDPKRPVQKSSAVKSIAADSFRRHDVTAIPDSSVVPPAPGSGRSSSTARLQDRPPELPIKSALEIRRERRSKEHLQTNRLSTRIMNAILENDYDQALRLVSEMEELKGLDHPYVLKLKAYMLIRQGKLSQARALLSRALLSLPDDCEAGLNMAVIDMLEGNHTEARARLEGLQDLYPEKRSIARYLSQLER